ncbi:MAG: fatty acyl-AMP ligase [Phormidesmis sp.]
MPANFFQSPVPSHIQTLVQLLAYRAESTPDKMAYAFLSEGDTVDVTVNYRQLYEQSCAIAAYLQVNNLSGERVLLFYPPGLDYISAFLGCLCAGAIAVPAYPPRRNQKMERLNSIVDNCKAAAVLTSAAICNMLQANLEIDTPLAKIRWLTTDAVVAGSAFQGSTSISGLTVGADSIAFLQYTSGSTGDPKGVIVSHSNILSNSASIYRFFGHTPESHALGWLPPYHDMGLIGSILQPLYGGFLGTLMPPVHFLQRPMRWLKAISRYQATTSGGPNFAFDLCVKKVKPEDLETLDLSCWRVAFNGAEPIRCESLTRFAETFSPCGFRMSSFYPCYGMAEATLIITGGSVSAPPVLLSVEANALEQKQAVVVEDSSAGGAYENYRTLVSSGRRQQDETLLVVDPDTLSVCAEGVVGEIWVAGPNIAQGYWDNSEKTQQSFGLGLDSLVGDQRSQLSAQIVRQAGDRTPTFMRTGDLGFLQAEELFVTGRIKDLIIIRGQNHYPQDIEMTVAACHPSLREDCGVACSVEVDGEERLVVVQEVERSHLRRLNAPEVFRAIKHAVTSEHKLQLYAIVLIKTGSLPKTSSGKKRRSACQSDFRNDRLTVVEDWCENPRLRNKYKSLKTDIERAISSMNLTRQNATVNSSEQLPKSLP